MPKLSLILAALPFAAALALAVPDTAEAASCIVRNKRYLQHYQASYLAGQRAARRGQKAQSCRHLTRGLAWLQRLEGVLQRPACQNAEDAKALQDLRRVIASAHTARLQCGAAPQQLPPMRTQLHPPAHAEAVTAL